MAEELVQLMSRRQREAAIVLVALVVAAGLVEAAARLLGAL